MTEITQDQLKLILQKAPKGSDPKKIIKALQAKGHAIQGLPDVSQGAKNLGAASSFVAKGISNIKNDTPGETIKPTVDTTPEDEKVIDFLSRRGIDRAEAIKMIQEDKATPAKGIVEGAFEGFKSGQQAAKDIVDSGNKIDAEEKDDSVMGKIADITSAPIDFVKDKFIQGGLPVARAAAGAVGEIPVPTIQPQDENKFQVQTIDEIFADIGKNTPPEMKEKFSQATGRVKEIFEKLPEPIQQTLKESGAIGEIIATFVSGGLAAKPLKEFTEEGFEAANILTKEAKDAIAPTFESMKKASIEKAGRDAEKLATEILQPSKKDLQLAKLAGDTTSDAVKEYIKVAEVSKTFDEAIEKLSVKVSEDFNKRNEILKRNNFTINQEKPLAELEKYIAETEAKGLAKPSEIIAMREVLENERVWLGKNKPDRLTAQRRKEDIYNEAKPLYKKQEMGTALENEAGRIKAFEMLGRGYKEVVENGDKTIQALNSTYGGRLGALEMLASRGALAEKALTPTIMQRIAEPVVTLFSGATGAGSAAFVAKLAARQQAKLSSLTKKLIKLRDKAADGKITAKEFDEIIDEIKLLPAPSDTQFRSKIESGKTINLPSKSPSTVEADEMTLINKGNKVNTNSSSARPMALPKNLKLTDAYPENFLGYNMKNLDKIAKEKNYNLYEALVKKVDSKTTTAEKMKAMESIMDDLFEQ